jgi:hypothetical protein
MPFTIKYKEKAINKQLHFVKAEMGTSAFTKDL